MHNAIVIAAVALVTGAGMCLAQPPGITREMIERALPLEDAPLGEPGPYEATSQAAFGSPGYHVYRPTSLGAFPKKDPPPVMVRGNGGCAGAARRQETADDMRATIDLAEKENARAGSPLKGKMAVGVFNSGKNCTRCTNSNWDVKSKGIRE